MPTNTEKLSQSRTQLLQMIRDHNLSERELALCQVALQYLEQRIGIEAKPN